MSKREDQDGKIKDIPSQEIADKIAAEQADRQLQTNKGITRIMRNRVISHIADEDDQSEMIIRLMIVLTGIGRLLIQKGIITGAEASAIPFALDLNSKTQTVLDAITATADAIANDTDIETFLSTLDGIIPPS
jgi:hypothetical protein